MSNHQAPTPPHHPTYNVHLSQDQIGSIAQAIFPHFQLEQLDELEHGKSYNNRIYFLDLAPTGSNEGTNRLNVVLKVCGSNFGVRKVQNEVGALLLLRQNCPSIPTPTVHAWSEDGKTIECVGSSRSDMEVLSAGGGPYGSYWLGPYGSY